MTIEKTSVVFYCLSVKSKSFFSRLSEFCSFCGYKLSAIPFSVNWYAYLKVIVMKSVIFRASFYELSKMSTPRSTQSRIHSKTNVLLFD